jgi:hypothetical protein
MPCTVCSSGSGIGKGIDTSTMPKKLDCLDTLSSCWPSKAVAIAAPCATKPTPHPKYSNTLFAKPPEPPPHIEGKAPLHDSLKPTSTQSCLTPLPTSLSNIPIEHHYDGTRIT